MIYVRLVGGLGNQMFQYAAARSLAHRLGVDVALDLRAFERHRLRNYGLGNFQISASAASASELRRWPAAARPFVHRSKWLGKVLRWNVTPYFDFDDHWMELEDGILLDGFFQSERYFESVSDVLSIEFLPLASLGTEELSIVDTMRSVNSVAIHVRRGDYVANPAAFRVHGVCSTTYYESAIRLFREQDAQARFFVFSDDPEWARSRISAGEDAVYVAGNQQFPELDLHLMSHCRNFIIANSTFSWWAAWLGTRRRGAGLVIAPDPWFADASLRLPQIIPLSWRVLPR